MSQNEDLAGRKYVDSITTAGTALPTGDLAGRLPEEPEKFGWNGIAGFGGAMIPPEDSAGMWVSERDYNALRTFATKTAAALSVQAMAVADAERVSDNLRLECQKELDLRVAAEKAVAERGARIAELERFIARLNNSVFGSEGFFLEPSAIDEIENGKALTNEAYTAERNKRIEAESSLKLAEADAIEAANIAMAFMFSHMGAYETFSPYQKEKFARLQEIANKYPNVMSALAPAG